MKNLQAYATTSVPTTSNPRVLLNPEEPASFGQKKFLAAIFKNQGLRFDFAAKITKGEASEIITEYAPSMPKKETRFQQMAAHFKSLR